MKMGHTCSASVVVHWGLNDNMFLGMDGLISSLLTILHILFDNQVEQANLLSWGWILY